MERPRKKGDFSEPREPVDGVFEQLFAVRDLASHYQLAWMPATGAVAEQAIAAMGALFDEHGAPLLVKCDNGSAFISDAFRAFLDKRGVLLLYSPPRHPPYNGAIERANGVLKTYTQQHAAAEAHPFRWTSDDVEAARQLANTLSRPWGYRGATPEEAWRARERIGDEQRQVFQAAAERERELGRKDLDLPPTGVLSREDQARLDRLALQRALCALDYLEMHRADRPKKVKRLSRAELAKLAAEDSAKPPAVGVAADAAVEAPVEATIEKPQAAAAAPPNETSAVDLAIVDSPVEAQRATAESNNAPPHKVASGAVQENEQLQLAPPMAADTMRAAADGAASVHSGAAPPVPAQVEPAKPPWPLRFIAPLFARPKTAKIS